MATIEELVVQLTAETSSLRAELSSAAKATQANTDKMNDAIKSFSDNSTKNLTFFESALASMAGFLGSNVVTGAFNKLQDAAAFAFAQLAEGADAAMKEELALTRLSNSLAQSGNYSQKAAQDLAAFTSAMEEQTGVGDDVVASNLAVLSSITKLDSEGLQKAQKAALDMSAALGIDLDSATRLVAKGIEGNVEAFKRYGISIEEGSSKAQNFTNVVTALNGQFGGAAAGNMKTFQGSVTGLNNAWGNLTEEFAKTITQNPVVIAGISALTGELTKMTGETADSSVALKQNIAEGFIAVIEGVQAAVMAIDTFVRVMEAGVRTILLPINALADGIRYVGDLLDGNDTSNAFANTKAQFEDLVNAVEGETALSKLGQKLADMGAAGRSAFDEIGASGAAVAPTIGGVTTKVQELTEAQKAQQEVLKSFAQGLADNANAIAANYAFEHEMLELSLQQELILKEEYGAQETALLQEKFAAQNEALEQARAQNLITEQQYFAAAGELSKQHATDAMQLQAKIKEFEKTTNKDRTENLKSTFSNIATLQSSSSKELAAIGKAAAITTATIDGYAAVQKALASAPPPINFGLAALVGVATAANVAKIAGVGLASGITEVPASASGGNLGDNFPAILQSGERVVDSQTNQDLKAFLANQGKGGSQQMIIHINIAPGTGITREQAAMIAHGIQDAQAAGMV